MSVKTLIEQGQIGENKSVGAVVFVFVNGLDPILGAVQDRHRRRRERMNRDRRNLLLPERL